VDLDPQLVGAGARLTELAARGTVSGIRTRITASKAARRDQETIQVLEEIIDELLSERSELLRIAKEFESVLVAERISDDEIEFVAGQLGPKLEELLGMAGSSYDPGEVRAMLELVVSRESITILQVLGFNFREAVGRPLTDLLARAIESQGPLRPEDPERLQRAQLEAHNALAQIALDPDAYDRFRDLIGRP